MQRLLRVSPAVHYIGEVGSDYGSSYISDSVYELVGYMPEDFTEDPDFWANHIHPEDRERVLGEFAATQLLHNDHQTVEYRFRHADGSYRWMHDSTASTVRTGLTAPTESTERTGLTVRPGPMVRTA